MLDAWTVFRGNNEPQLILRFDPQRTKISIVMQMGRIKRTIGGAQIGQSLACNGEIAPSHNDQRLGSPDLECPERAVILGRLVLTRRVGCINCLKVDGFSHVGGMAVLLLLSGGAGQGLKARSYQMRRCYWRFTGTGDQSE